MARLSDKAKRELFRKVGVFNGWTFADFDGGQPYISYRPQDNGRGGQWAAWQVVRPGYRTDPDGFWRDGGHKTFPTSSPERRNIALEQAKEWASKRYGITEWAKTPFGEWMDKKVAEEREAALLKRLAEGGVDPADGL